jgi:methionine-rich copper-binding protein CopC
VNGTVTASPSELDLKFSEGVNLAFTGVEVKGPGKKAVATGKAALRAGDDTTLVVPLSGTLAAGTYTVAWHALSTDGHKTQGSYRFTIKP